MTRSTQGKGRGWLATTEPSSVLMMVMVMMVTMVMIVTLMTLIISRQMREFQSAGPSSTLNSARGSTHGSLGSNLHQVDIIVIAIITIAIIAMNGIIS